MTNKPADEQIADELVDKVARSMCEKIEDDWDWSTLFIVDAKDTSETGREVYRQMARIALEAALSVQPAEVELSGDELQMLLSVKDRNHAIIEKAGDRLTMAFSLSDRGFLALEQMIGGVQLHITRLGIAAIRSALSPSTAPQEPVGEWRYEIQYGPEGEDNYAWVYSGKDMIATMKTHHAIKIVLAMNTLATPDATALREEIDSRSLAVGIVERIRGYDYVQAQSTSQHLIECNQVEQRLRAALAPVQSMEGGE